MIGNHLGQLSSGLSEMDLSEMDLSELFLSDADILLQTTHKRSLMVKTFSKGNWLIRFEGAMMLNSLKDKIIGKISTKQNG